MLCEEAICNSRLEAYVCQVNFPLDNMLDCMLMVALHEASRTLTPDNPPDIDLEIAADEYCLRFARMTKAEPMSPKVASALVPRLRAAKSYLKSIESQPVMQARTWSTGNQATVEYLLVNVWHKRLKAQWLAGKFENSGLQLQLIMCEAGNSLSAAFNLPKAA